MEQLKRLIERPLLAGFVSAIMVITYCGVIVMFFYLMEEVFPASEQNFFLMAFMLVLLVLSAAVCGILVFGVPIFYLIQKEIRKSGIYMASNLITFVLFLVIVANVILLNEMF